MTDKRDIPEQPHDEPPPVDTPAEKKRRFNWLVVAILAAIAAGVLLASSVWQGSWGGGDDEATSEEVAAKPDPEKWCAAQGTYDNIRRELFRRAAQVRGSDEQSYARLADFALLRVNGPVVRSVDERLDSVTCSGSAVLSLPPGVSVSGGRRSLSGDVEYSVQPAADGTGNVVRVGNADAIVVPLATLSRTSGSSSAPLVPPNLDTGAVPPVAEPSPVQDPVERPEPTLPVSANPSFNCNAARTRGEIAICGDPGLAALDRQMASQFNGALREASRDQRALLERTRGRFLSYRDRCGTNQCIAETYRSRMREIGDIMADRWRG
ncbi:hypothetical protein H8M03_02460 [Sphingomonas sabuli]|uniref:Lysozyme inhibitor LprI N-terminal domain-containing protein n=1 Tax=Sphingomonas sabuli TaxID=2764186 RepID=A0A7G9L3N3_9SPHN|nr:hypothetical protein [Sphingomonas sabuli]QNM83232.1 hypothetical protein H8M03_02460 [Sphingomonas sabuli]